ncbi:hypothetical protein BKA67DRAFT_534368 [Truncatella angustata]|uniref:Uncharacterized protein n=1 Tax=Truncatella angustata TaxID=152316 RepID=A0A9P8UNH4_9PEZI|nr:uncharacterized protein BKA67DRAFT_534368 [Truncatella angustata]KAH6655443.1 hypothetical protein BKA67DRAFT_534368 [Truncatella angustata]
MPALMDDLDGLTAEQLRRLIVQVCVEKWRPRSTAPLRREKKRKGEDARQRKRDQQQENERGDAKRATPSTRSMLARTATSYSTAVRETKPAATTQWRPTLILFYT